MTDSGKKFISGSGLKLIAVVTMIIDHVAVFLLREGTLFTACRIIGRIAFPTFAFLLVEGYLHTKDRRRYGASLLILGLVSEIPWNLAQNGTLFYLESQNVLFTLFLAYLGICMYEKYKGKTALQVIWIGGLLAVSHFLKADFGPFGFATVMCMYLLRNFEILRMVACTCATANPASVLAFFPIHFYDGERGFINNKVLKYLFYAVYPVHLLILWSLR